MSKSVTMGWHVPSDADWPALTDYFGGLLVAAVKMKSVSGWEGEGNNNSGFAGLPGGYRSTSIGSFLDAGWYGYWWSAIEGHTRRTLDRVLHYAWDRDFHYERMAL